MQNFGKKIGNSKTIWKTGSKNNEKIKKIAKQFEIKSILAYLHDGIDNKDIQSIFSPYFSDSCKKYYDLSSSENINSPLLITDSSKQLKFMYAYILD